MSQYKTESQIQTHKQSDETRTTTHDGGSTQKTNETATSPATKFKTYRFEFSKEFNGELSRFSKVHQYDERRAYKEQWAAWKTNPEIADLMMREFRRLEESGFVGDIEDKMFKSGRYYFRKKTSKKTNDNVNVNNDDVDKDDDTPLSSNIETSVEAADDGDGDETNNAINAAAAAANNNNNKQQRRPYITMSKSCIRMMDEHIKNSSSVNPSEFKPSSSYDNFYQEKMSSQEMSTEIGIIIEKFQKTLSSSAATAPQSSSMMSSVESITKEIMDKIKKTYKNRYYRFVKQ